MRRVPLHLAGAVLGRVHVDSDILIVFGVELVPSALGMVDFLAGVSEFVPVSRFDCGGAFAVCPDEGPGLGYGEEEGQEEEKGR